MSWQSENDKSWWRKMIEAIWDDLKALWDDPVVTWDEVSNTGWQDDNQKIWQAKQSKEYQQTAVGTWYHKN